MTGTGSPTFEAFPKIPRLRRDVVVTEKIDGTNACVVIEEAANSEPGAVIYNVYAQSRNRLILPGDDNYGFATWVHTTQDLLIDVLGPGRHYGEWWGQGIGRRYGQDRKWFSLFNVARWGWMREPTTVGQFKAGAAAYSNGLTVVPTLATGIISDRLLEDALIRLQVHGSVAAPGFMKPEGIIVWHEAARSMFKVTIEGDAQPKGAAA